MYNEPRKIPNFNTTLLLFYVDTRKNLKARRGNEYHFIHKGKTFPTGTMRLVVRSYGLWEAYTQTCPKWDNFFSTTCWCSSMIACQVWWILDEFWITRIFKPSISMFAAEWRWQGVWHSFPFLAWDLSVQPRTQIWFFNQFICTGACARSSNLNYAHKCIENSVNI
jgi:hypothetical protein